MTTKAAGGTINGILALTLEAQAALQVNDAVMVTGDYECNLADGSKPVVGHVSVRNVRRQLNTGVYPVANAPGDVTVEARGWYVRSYYPAAAITAGVLVRADGASASGTPKIRPWVAGTDGVDQILGIALMHATGASTTAPIDVLVK